MEDRCRCLAGPGEVTAGTHLRRSASRSAAWASRAARTPWMHHHRVMLVVVAAMVTGVLAEREAGEENHRDDKHDPGDDGNPRRELEDPMGLTWRLG
jgi:hypothetical protein